MQVVSELKEKLNHQSSVLNNRETDFQAISSDLSSAHKSCVFFMEISYSFFELFLTRCRRERVETELEKTREESIQLQEELTKSSLRMQELENELRSVDEERRLINEACENADEQIQRLQRQVESYKQEVCKF